MRSISSSASSISDRDEGPACVVTSGSLFFFQAEDGIRNLVRSRGLGDVYKRQLRFDLQRPNETTSEFTRRVNREAAVNEDGGASGSSAANWTVGPEQRDKGSLHQDIWSGDGPELAATGGVLAVHAVGGWWKNNNRKDRIGLPIRYALLVSLRTRAEDVDLYTPIATSLAVPIEAAPVEV